MTTAIQASKVLVPLPGWVEAMGRGGKVTDEASAFARVPLVFRALQLRCNSLADVPVHLKRGETEVDWPFDQGLKGLIWKTEAALLLTGAAFWLKLDNRIARTGAQWLNPFTIEVRLPLGSEPLAENIRFIQRVNGKQTGDWGVDEIAYFKDFNPGDDIGPGIPAARVALGSAQLHDYATRFAGEFFAHGAMPTALVSFGGNPNDEDIKSAAGFFKRAMSGVGRAFRILAVRGDVKHSIFTPPIKDLAMPELMGQARAQIGLAFGIPQTMLEDAANFATAKEHEMSFMTKTIRPRTHLYEEVINDQFLDRTDLRLEFAPDEMDIFQEDEAARSASLVHLEGAGVPLKLAMEILGYDLTDEQWAELEKQQAEKPEPAQFPFQPRNPNSFAEEDERGMQQDMRAWERKALKRLKQGGSLRFESAAIPSGLMGAIEGALSTAKTPDAVRAIFADSATWKSRPVEVRRVEEDEMKAADVLAMIKATQPAMPAMTLSFPGAQVTIQNDPEAIAKGMAAIANAERPEVVKAAESMERAARSMVEANIEARKATSDSMKQVAAAVAGGVKQFPPIVIPAPVVQNTVVVPRARSEHQKVKRDRNKLIESTETTIEYED